MLPWPHCSELLAPGIQMEQECSNLPSGQLTHTAPLTGPEGTSACEPYLTSQGCSFPEGSRGWECAALGNKNKRSFSCRHNSALGSVTADTEPVAWVQVGAWCLGTKTRKCNKRRGFHPAMKLSFPSNHHSDLYLLSGAQGGPTAMCHFSG